MFSFGLVQNFEPFSRPFRATVEKSYLVQFDVELSQLFKTVRDLKIGQTLASWATLRGRGGSKKSNKRPTWFRYEPLAQILNI